MLTERQRMILEAIIDDYILTGIPVGSRTLSKRADMGLSSATIRNEMSDLEEEGYLEQPHTSAGRLPSDKAYRLYVDTLMRVGVLEESERKLISHYFNSKIDEIENVIKTTARALSDVTNLTSVVLTPQMDRTELRRIQLVRLSQQKAILIFVFNTGLVKDVMVGLSDDMDDSYLEMVSNIMSEYACNRRITDAFDALNGVILSELSLHREFMSQIVSLVQANSHSKSSREVVFGGTKNILNHPEYRDVDKAKNFLQLLETKDELYDILSRATDMEFSIKIGSENELEQLKDMSMVTATYKLGGKSLGSFGVIGPTRMNYSKVLSIMGYVSSSMNELIRCFLDIDDEI